MVWSRRRPLSESRAAYPKYFATLQRARSSSFRSRRPKQKPDGYIEPCAAIRHAAPPAGPAWIHEIKQDGWRILARRDGHRVRLWTRGRIESSDRFARITAALLALPATSCAIDGEAVVRRQAWQEACGHCDFHALRGRDAAIAGLVAFDLLELDGRNLRHAPLEERRATLAALLPPAPAGAPLTYSHGFDGEGADVFVQACALGLEGIVSKRRGSIYKSGPFAGWIKVLNPDYRR